MTRKNGLRIFYCLFSHPFYDIIIANQAVLFRAFITERNKNMKFTTGMTSVTFREKSIEEITLLAKKSWTFGNRMGSRQTRIALRYASCQNRAPEYGKKRTSLLILRLLLPHRRPR